MSNAGDLLAGLIALAGNDKKAAQRLSDIQSKVAEHDAAEAKVAASKIEADARIKAADQREAEIKASADKLSAQSDEIDAKKKELLSAQSAFEIEKSAHTDNISVLKDKASSHQNDVAAFEISKQNFEIYLKAKNQEIAKLEDVAKSAEIEAKKHESDAAAIKTKLQAKLDAVVNAAKE